MATAEQDARDEFATALKAAGLVLEKEPLMDGQLHRVPVEGATKGTRDGSYVGFLDGKPSGYIENFKTGHKEKWTTTVVQSTPQERADAAAQMHLARQQRAAELAAQHRHTADKVLVKWEGLADVPPSGQNAYLARKGVAAHGVKFDGERLVVPVRDVDGKLWSVQSIPPEEGAPKMFEKGGRKGGNMHLIGEPEPGAVVLVAEGYATGASLHQATGKAVAVAFDAGNLDAVVGAIKQRYPTSPVLIMGDDDRSQQPNVGYDKATEAGRKHQVGVAFPAFQEPGKLSDFNDLHVREGLSAVKAQVEPAVARAVADHMVPWPVALLHTPLSPTLDRVAPLILPGAVVPPVHPSSRTAPAAEPVAIQQGKADNPPDAGEQLTARDGAIGASHTAQLLQVGGPLAHTAVQAVGAVDAAKIASDVAQGKEVRTLDVASAAASVTMTTGLGGPAVQLGAQAVAGISAIDAGQRAVNTADTKLKEPDPADAGERKEVEQRNDELFAVPRNGLDEQTARQVVKLDIASLHAIDNPRERQAAAVAMGQNAENQSNYKAELARQDPHTAEFVALAYAREQQSVFTKEDRKAADLSAPSLSKAPVNSIEYVASREPQAEPSAVHRSDPPLEDRFNIVTRFARGRDYQFRDQPGKVAFKERWLSLTSTVDTAAVVKAMLDRAQERGWTKVRVKGSQEFQRQAWIAATARGIKAVGYEPTDGDRIAANEERARLGKERGMPLAQSGRSILRERQPAQDNSPARSAPPQAEREEIAPLYSERASRKADTPQRSAAAAREREEFSAARRAGAEMPVAKPLRAFLTERGDALKDVEATVALVSERMGQGRAHVGQVVAHGRDHFAFDKNNGQSYYVKLHSPAGEKVVWGVDLRRALEEGQIKVGDSVVLANRDVRPVTIAVKDRDASGNVVGQHEEAVKRNTWYAANIEQLRREAARGEPDRGQPLPSRDSGLNRTTTAPTTDRPLSPAATRNERSNSRDAAILQVFESALDAKHVPEEMRPGLREQARNKLDLHKALGQPVKVAIYDPAAPSREPRRTVQMPQRQHKEQERSR